MDRDLYILEEFHPYPNELRAHALTCDYEDWLGHDGQVYKRVCITDIPLMETIITHLFGSVKMLGMAYRLNYQDEPPNAAIHSDLGWGTHAMVLYLSEGDSGTAFWKHKQTGKDRILPAQDDLLDEVCADWNDETKWERIINVDMKFNKAIVYKSCLFHSRYPFKAFGDSPESGRLIAVAFFTPEKLSD